jgi:hypothetical protein
MRVIEEAAQRLGVGSAARKPIDWRRIAIDSDKQTTQHCLIYHF